jgi:pimeloyl-ACP methyl ester carboxylesterase
MSTSDTPTVVLVHGGFVDGSGWQGVYDQLKPDGYDVSVVQNPTISHADDVAVTRRAIEARREPVILVGHSYGGAVITEAGNHPTVAALVYIAAFAPDNPRRGRRIASPGGEAPLGGAGSALRVGGQRPRPRPDSVVRSALLISPHAGVLRDEGESYALSNLQLELNGLTELRTHPTPDQAQSQTTIARRVGTRTRVRVCVRGKAMRSGGPARSRVSRVGRCERRGGLRLRPSTGRRAPRRSRPWRRPRSGW